MKRNEAIRLYHTALRVLARAAARAASLQHDKAQHREYERAERQATIAHGQFTRAAALLS